MSSTAWQQLKQLAEPQHRAFSDALQNTAVSQAQQLQTLLKQNHNCQFGQHHDFSKIRTASQYQTTVPIHTYQQLQPYVELMLGGQKQVLSDESVLWYERTSGTTKQAKMIPYTAAALRAFQAALYPWLYDLLTQYPNIMQGSAYWSISPVGREPQQTADGTPIGCHNDALYLGQQGAALIAQTLAVPPWVAEIQSIDAWQYITLRYLLSDANLSLISIWSPTFLLQLLKALPAHADQLIQDIGSGQVTEPGLSDHLAHVDFAPNPQRAEELSRCIRPGVLDTRRIWPKLVLISCWSSASSQVYAAQLQSLFPAVSIQPKGLLATEGVISLPLCASDTPVLAVQSGFYEFIDSAGQVSLAHQLVTGRSYSVLLSNPCGLYRYQIGDQVRVTDWHHTAPCLDFIGRGGSTTDLCGEKLSEDFVLPLLKQIPGFTLLVANPLPQPHYCLYVDAAMVPKQYAEQLPATVEQHLKQNPHYQYARHLGQLAAVKVIRTSEPMDRYYHHQQQQGLGDIKPPSLSQDVTWHQQFMGVTDEQSLSV